MRTFLTLFFLFAILSNTVSQDIVKVSKAKDEALTGADTAKHWNISGTGNLAVSQAAFANWSAGGENSIGLDAFINLKANYKKHRHAWANVLDVGFGFQILGKEGDAQFKKTNDKLEYTTAYGYQLHKNGKWYATALVNFRTQFANGYNYPDDSTIISKFMAPGYVVAGVGVTYAPVKWFSLYLSPTSGRFTFVMDQALADSGAFGVERGKNLRKEFGPYLRADLNKDLAKNVNLATSLELFTDYFHEFGNIDVNWSLLLTMKVNNWLAATISTQLIYDNDVMIKSTPTSAPGPATQFKEMLGIGLTYSFK